jgi:hypothetical protein
MSICGQNIPVETHRPECNTTAPALFAWQAFGKVVGRQSWPKPQTGRKISGQSVAAMLLPVMPNVATTTQALAVILSTATPPRFDTGMAV